VRQRLTVLAFLLASLPAAAAGQEQPFRVTIFDWDSIAFKMQRDMYRAEARQHEVLFCVEAWNTDSTADIQRVIVTRVRRAGDGGQHYIAAVETRCIAQDGTRLPTIHTHSDGNCQFSPRDLVSIAARVAPFEAVQCGERHFIWAMAWQIVAMANASAALQPPLRARAGTVSAETRSLP
jgi:hypothetical protein